MRFTRGDIAKLPAYAQEAINNQLAVPARNVEPDTLDAIARAYEMQAFGTPVDIHIHSCRHRLADADGISAKWVIDQLVNDRLLQDDSPEFVRSVTFSQEKGKEEWTRITITEV